MHAILFDLLFFECQEKKVTIVHGDSLLLNDAYPKYFRREVAKEVVGRGVDVVLGDFVDDLEPSESGVIKTRNGKRIIADLVVRTFHVFYTTWRVLSLPLSGALPWGETELWIRNTHAWHTFRNQTYPRIFYASSLQLPPYIRRR